MHPHGVVRIGSSPAHPLLNVCQIKKFDGPAKNNVVLEFGFVNGEYYGDNEYSPKSLPIKEKAMNFYWCHSKKPYCGFQVLKRCKHLDIKQECQGAVWHFNERGAMRMKHIPPGSTAIAEFEDPRAYLQTFKVGRYISSDLFHAVLFFDADPKTYAE